MAELNLDKLVEIVEVNLGRWKPEAVAIVDVNHKVWCQKGNVSGEILDYYNRFPLLDMHLGDSLHNNNTFLMKVTERTGIIVVMNDPQVARLAAINLRGRINALSDF